ncbi:MAG: flagellar export chaperone FliS [Phycisphaerae bacterium]
MSTNAKASFEYLKSAVQTATPEQLQVMLFDGAIRFSLRGREAIERKDHEATFNNIERAQRIVLEIAGGLKRDVNPEVADRMSALYNFVYRRLVDAVMEHSTAAVDDALRILRQERETWQVIVDKLSKEGLRGGAALPTAGTPAAASLSISG